MENNKSSAGIIAAVLAVLVIGGGTLWFVNRDTAETDTQANNQTQQTEAEPQQEAARPNIVGLAAQTESLSTLVTAVKAAELVDTLQAKGPYTVFAPTNAAFDALPAGTLATLLKPENIGQLKSVLTYHVVSGKVLAQDLKDGQVITTVQGGTLTVSLMDGKAYLTDAKGNKVMVEKADVNADNGVVHIIGGVLLPS
jgi:uncharacterized surface protein with fasciclin (FAS1) repeats